MGELIKRFTSRKLLVTFAMLSGLWNTDSIWSADPGSALWIAVIGAAVASIYVLAQGFVDRGLVDQASNAIKRGLEQGRELTEQELQGEYERRMVELDDVKDKLASARGQKGFMRLRAMFTTCFMVLVFGIGVFWIVGCDVKTWRVIQDAHRRLCDSYADFSVDNGLATNETERVIYMAACLRDPQIAVTAYEQAELGQPIPRLTPAK